MVPFHAKLVSSVNAPDVPAYTSRVAVKSDTVAEANVDSPDTPKVPDTVSLPVIATLEAVTWNSPLPQLTIKFPLVAVEIVLVEPVTVIPPILIRSIYSLNLLELLSYALGYLTRGPTYPCNTYHRLQYLL